MRKLITAVFIAVALAACATPQSPQQAVFETKSGYAVALTAAVSYKRLPLCEKTKPPCSDPKVVAQLQRADNVAASALDAAEQAARTPGFGDSVVASSATAAQAALQAFVAITTNLGR